MEITADIEKYVDDPEQFRGWLKTFEPGSSVGKVRLVYEHPLAKYLQARSGDETIGVWGHLVLNIYGAPAGFLPIWAADFTVKSDAGRITGQPITASEALTTLEKILREGK